MDPDTNVTDGSKFQCGFLCGYLLGTGQLGANTIPGELVDQDPEARPTHPRARPYQIPGELINQDLEVRPTHPRARPYQIPGELVNQDLEVRPTHPRARPYQIPANLIHQDFAGRLAARAEGTNSSSTTPTGSKRGSHHLDPASDPDAKRRRLKKKHMRYRFGTRTNASAKIPANTASAKVPTSTASAKVPAAIGSVKVPTTTTSAKVPTTTASTKVPKHKPKCEPEHEPKREPKREPKEEPIDLLSHPPAPYTRTIPQLPIGLYPQFAPAKPVIRANTAEKTGHCEAVTKGMFLEDDIKVEGRRAYTINKRKPC